MQICHSPRSVFELTATAVLVNDVQRKFLFQGHTHRAQEDSHGSGYAPLLADYFSDIFRCDAQFEYGNAFASQRPNLNPLGLINQGLCELFDQLAYFCRLVWHRSEAPKMWGVTDFAAGTIKPAGSCKILLLAFRECDETQSASLRFAASPEMPKYEYWNDLAVTCVTA